MAINIIDYYWLLICPSFWVLMKTKFKNSGLRKCFRKIFDQKKNFFFVLENVSADLESKIFFFFCTQKKTWKKFLKNFRPKKKFFFLRFFDVFLWKIKNKTLFTHENFSISALVFEIFKLLCPVSALGVPSLARVLNY